ncbi:PseG/SpsG family protein [Modestobacter roseus]|uniref:PseG/SpsG family protein n=1 Tax=Modestobacter roseus TaxID=1181884 RepID=UPI0034DE5A90
MSRDVLLLCEAARATGLGHLVRSLALATELAGRGREVTIALRPDALPEARDRVRAAGLTLATGGWVDPDLRAGAPGTVVVDSYRVTGAELTGLHRRCGETGARLVVIDDLADRSFTADVVVNQNVGAESLSYPGAGTVLRGPRHALLRPAFPAARTAGLRSAAELPDVPRRVFVLFGGTDAAGMAGTAAAAALRAFPHARVRVVVPGAAPVPAEVTASPRATVLPPVDAVHEEMLDADLVVSAGGTSLWELCCLARATAVVAVAENQLPTYDRLTAAGHVLGAGRHPGATVGELADRLRTLTAPPGTLGRVARSAATVTDGAGCARVADALAG